MSDSTFTNVLVLHQQAAAVDDIAVKANKAAALDELIVSINTAHESAQKNRYMAMEYALRAGVFLIQAKELVPHGKWRDWLVEHFSHVGETSIQGYMRLAHYVEKHPNEKEQMLAGSVRNALAAIAVPRAETKKKPKPQRVADLKPDVIDVGMTRVAESQPAQAAVISANPWPTDRDLREQVEELLVQLEYMPKRFGKIADIQGFAGLVEAFRRFAAIYATDKKAPHVH